MESHLKAELLCLLIKGRAQYLYVCYAAFFVQCFLELIQLVVTFRMTRYGHRLFLFEGKAVERHAVLAALVYLRLQVEQVGSLGGDYLSYLLLLDE